jgi:hypothetical protein
MTVKVVREEETFTTTMDALKKEKSNSYRMIVSHFYIILGLTHSSSSSSSIWRR